MNEPTMETLARRLNKVERENGRWKHPPNPHVIS